MVERNNYMIDAIRPVHHPQDLLGIFTDFGLNRLMLARRSQQPRAVFLRCDVACRSWRSSKRSHACRRRERDRRSDISTFYQVFSGSLRSHSHMHPVRLDGTPRVHTSCPKVPADVEASWGRIKLDRTETRNILAEGAPR